MLVLKALKAFNPGSISSIEADAVGKEFLDAGGDVDKIQDRRRQTRVIHRYNIIPPDIGSTQNARVVEGWHC